MGGGEWTSQQSMLEKMGETGRKRNERGVVGLVGKCNMNCRDGAEGKKGRL